MSFCTDNQDQVLASLTSLMVWILCNRALKRQYFTGKFSKLVRLESTPRFWASVIHTGRESSHPHLAFRDLTWDVAYSLPELRRSTRPILMLWSLLDMLLQWSACLWHLLPGHRRWLRIRLIWRFAHVGLLCLEGQLPWTTIATWELEAPVATASPFLQKASMMRVGNFSMYAGTSCLYFKHRCIQTRVWYQADAHLGRVLDDCGACIKTCFRIHGPCARCHWWEGYVSTIY